MTDTVLITRSEYDDTNFYLYKWSEIIISIANEAGISIFDLKNERLNRNNFSSYVKDKSPKILLLNGHGSELSVHGHKNEVILDLGNISLLKSKIVYSRSCRSAKVLGFHAVKEFMAEAFIGYKNDFIFPYDTNRTANPPKDKVCKPIMESSNRIGISLVRGKSPKEAYESSQEAYSQWIRHCIKSKDIEAPHILKFLIWNKINQIIIES
jgi:CRISPR/Cas system CMR-associated protein Cmr5 small subunit